MAHQLKKTCPRCGNEVVRSGGLTADDAGHIGHVTYHTMGVTGLAIGAGIALVKAFTPKAYRCSKCGLKFGD